MLPKHPEATDFADNPSFDDLRKLSIDRVRNHIRIGNYTRHTSGLGAGLLQGNIAILPSQYALDFFRFCQRNPQPCPVVGVSDTGVPGLKTLGEDIDIITDVPKYNIYRQGELKEQVTDLSEYWTDDLVTFVLGCSFSFEEALTTEGIPLRHIDENKTVPMYRTNIPTVAAGPFKGEYVVSMRPMSVANAIRACDITARFPQAHGQPVHIGVPEEIGITDISKPDWGDPPDIHNGEVAVFWACGVTPQNSIQQARIPLCITHTPGSMLITDIPSWDHNQSTRHQKTK
ncbi:MAG: putative hydro-lyase [Sneathiella sp.]